MKKKRILGAASAVAFATVGAVAFAAPAQAITCYEDGIYYLWDVETWQETSPAVPEVPGTPAIPGTPEAWVAQGDYADTRVTGHYEAGVDGLHIWTEGATSTDKVAGYLPVNVNLADALDAALHYTGTVGINPGAQLKVDIDGDSVSDGILVGESVYGDNWWLTGGSSDAFKAFDPSGAENGGNGSEWFGTLAEWSASIPNATVTHVGFSLGSGVLGDGMVEGFTIAGTNISFVAHIPAVPEVEEVPAQPAVPAQYGWVATGDDWGIEHPDTTFEEAPVVGDTRNVNVTTAPLVEEVECPVTPEPVDPEPEPEPVTPPTDDDSGTPANVPVKSSSTATLAETGGYDVAPILPIGAAAAVLLGIAATLASAMRRKSSTN